MELVSKTLVVFLSYSGRFFLFVVGIVLLSHLTTLSATYTLGKSPLIEGLARHRDLYLTTYNIHKRPISIHLAGVEPAVPASELLQIHTLDRAATGGRPVTYSSIKFSKVK